MKPEEAPLQAADCDASRAGLEQPSCAVVAAALTKHRCCSGVVDDEYDCACEDAGL